jgi:tight adherence protein B
MLGLLALLVFSSVLALGYAFSAFVGRREAARRALATRLESVTGGGISSTPLLRDQRLSGIAFLHQLLSHASLVTPLVRMIRQAGLRRRVGEVLLYVPLLGAIGLLLGLLASSSVIVGFGFGMVGGAIPLLVVQRMRRQRAALFAEQLPDALDLIRAALQAGHSFVSALCVVGDEFPDPIAQEVRQVAEEVRLGLPLRDALENLVGRVDDPNLPILTVGILTAYKVGGNLAEVIDNISHTIRERAKLFREARALTAQGRLSGGILTLLPVAVGLGMYALNRQYFAPMLTTTAGHYMIGYSFVSLLWGHLVIRRLVSVKV